jgi:predicted peroxiredoxin
MNKQRNFTMRMRASQALFALALMGVAPALAGQSILSLLSAESAESQAFSLVLANQMQASGNAVELLLCGQAGDIALKAAPAAVTTSVTPQGASVKALAERFLKQGGKISVCAIYLPNRKLNPDALIDGVSVANPKQMADKIVDPAIRVIGQ